VTNKDCWFVANNVGSGTTALTVAALSATVGAGVYNSGSAAVPVYTYTAAYKPPINTGFYFAFAQKLILPTILNA
jgi:hypothetical protein